MNSFIILIKHYFSCIRLVPKKQDYLLVKRNSPDLLNPNKLLELAYYVLYGVFMNRKIHHF